MNRAAIGLLLAAVCLMGIKTSGEEATKTMNESPQFTLATYRVKVENHADFLKLMEGAEKTMREQGLITALPVFRMRSKEDPTLILEIFQWADPEAFGRAQQDPTILEWWGKYEKTWEKGGFGVDQFPEAAQPWAQLETFD